MRDLAWRSLIAARLLSAYIIPWRYVVVKYSFLKYKSAFLLEVHYLESKLQKIAGVKFYTYLFDRIK